MIKRISLALLFYSLSTQVLSDTLGCLILPKQETHLGTPITGVIERVLVDRGDRVKQGDILVQMHAEVEQAELAVTQARAEVVAAINAAEANVYLTENRYRRFVDLRERKMVSEQDFDQVEAELELARQQLAQSREQLIIFQREAALAEARLYQRAIKAPFDGVIIDRMAEPGERIEHHPVLRLAATHILRVELVLSSQQFGNIQPGDKVRVFPELAGLSPIDTYITLVDPIIDPASNTFRARLLINNEDLALPSGVRCRVELNSQ